MTDKNAKRNVDIEILRLVAILAIMALHFQEDKFGERVLFAGGYLGVDLFFLLAGFFCYMKCVKCELECKQIDVYDYGLFRIKKLYPPFVVIVFLWIILIFIQNRFDASFVVHHLWSTKYQWIWLHFLGEVGGYEFRTLWYLPIMFWTELVIVCLIKHNRKLFDSYALCFGVLIMAFLYHSFDSLSMQGEWVGVVQGGVVRALAEMILGCSAANICIKLKEEKIIANKKITINIIKFFCLLNVLIIMACFGFDKNDFWTIPNMFVLIILCWLSPSVIPKFQGIILYLSSHVYWVFLSHLLVSKY